MAVNVLQLRVSTTTPLGGAGTFTSSAQKATMDAARIVGIAFADQAGTVYVDQSNDGTNWDLSSSFAVAANTGAGFSVELVAPNWRLRYTNGAAAQGTFRLGASLRGI